MKIAIWTNNDKILSHLMGKTLNYIWKLQLVPKLRLFAWKLVRGKIPIKENLKKI